MRFVTLGVGAQNSPRYAPAGLLVSCAGAVVAIDGGPGAEPPRRLDAWVVTDDRAELIAPLRRMAARRGLTPAAVSLRHGGLAAECLPVMHTNHPTFGYLLHDPAGHVAVWAPEFLEFPGWAAGGLSPGCIHLGMTPHRRYRQPPIAWPPAGTAAFPSRIGLSPAAFTWGKPHIERLPAKQSRLPSRFARRVDVAWGRPQPAASAPSAPAHHMAAGGHCNVPQPNRALPRCIHLGQTPHRAVTSQMGSAPQPNGVGSPSRIAGRPDVRRRSRLEPADPVPGRVGGHLDVRAVAVAARAHGVRRLVFAHIGRSTIRALDGGDRPPFGEFAHDRQVFWLRRPAAPSST